MARPITGNKTRNPSGTWKLRIRRESWTIPGSERWSADQAQRELDSYVAQVRAGVFRGFPNTTPANDARGRLFEDAAADYLRRIETDSKSKPSPRYGLPGNQNDKRWRVAHLASFFAGRRIGAINLEAIESFQRFKQAESDVITQRRIQIKSARDEAAKVRREAGLKARSIRDPAARSEALRRADEAAAAALSEEDREWWAEHCNRKPLSDSSINKIVQTLGTILEREIKRQPGVLEYNWAKDEDARIGNVPKPDRYALNLDQLEAFLEAARILDTGAREDRRAVARETLFAFGVFTAARVTEQMSVRIRHLDLSRGHIYLHGTKTDAAGASEGRRVPIHPGLRPLLLRYLEERRGGCGPDDYLFVTGSGTPRTKDRYNELIGRTIPTANRLLADRGQLLLKDHFTSHAFRRTYITVMAELGENHGEVMRRVGHASAKLIHEVYNQVGQVGRMANDERLISLYGERGYDGFEKYVGPPE